MLFDTQFAEPYKSWAQFANSVGSLAAILAAATWFLATRKFRRRIQLDIDCKIYGLPGNPLKNVAEIQLCMENKGLVNHRIRELTVSVHSLKHESELDLKPTTGELIFPKTLLPKTNIVPKDYQYFFVRPGIRQVITHIIPIDSDASIIRVTAGFQYDYRGLFPHTVRRVFPVDRPKVETVNDHAKLVN